MKVSSPGLGLINGVNGLSNHKGSSYESPAYMDSPRDEIQADQVNKLVEAKLAKSALTEELDFHALTFGAETSEDAPASAGDISPTQAANMIKEETAELENAVVTTTVLVASDTPADSSPAAPARRLGPTDFELLAVVGKGSFGKVFQVRKKDSGEIYAMKIMSKTKILDKEHSEYILAESHILQQVEHPFIVTLRYSFQTAHKLYLVMDFVNGGHLFYNLASEGCFKISTARFFAAEMVSAVAYLHSGGFVHRDLKPENILLDREGHIKVTDFGLAKQDMGDDNSRANSFIGTMQYMAPEIINASGHGKAVDWWTVGILVFEMMTGYAPFEHKNKKTLQKMIVGGKLKFPAWFDDDARNFIRALLTREPTKRLGYGPDGSNDVKKHKFFKNINWARLETRTDPSPYKPEMKGNHESLERIHKLWTEEKVVDTPPSSPANTSATATFYNFTYTAPSTLLARFENAARES